MDRVSRRDIAEALGSGAFTFAWYALPDAVPSRPVRATVKAALAVGLLAITGVQARRLERRAGQHAEADDTSPTGPDADAAARIRALTRTAPVLDGSAIDTGHGRRPARTYALAGAAAALVAANVAGTVAAERGIHRYGQRLGARGVGHPHTRIGAVAGIAAVALSVATATLVPEPHEAHAEV